MHFFRIRLNFIAFYANIVHIYAASYAFYAAIDFCRDLCYNIKMEIFIYILRIGYIGRRLCGVSTFISIRAK